MRSHWLHRLAGLAAAVAVGLAVGPAHLTTGVASHPSVQAVARDCPEGTHWDDVLHACV
jgi:hypothetical protein